MNLFFPQASGLLMIHGLRTRIVLALVCAVLFGLRASAATIATVVGVAGWNADMIYENDSQSEVTETMNDGIAGYTFTEDGFVVAATTTEGLPSSGQVTSASMNGVTDSATEFQMQSFSGANALWLAEGGAVATLTLLAPARFSSLHFLNAAANGGKTISITLHYTDFTTDTTSFNALDWSTGGPGAAIGPIHRVIDTAQPPDGINPSSLGGQFWYLYESVIDLEALSFDIKQIASIDFRVTSGNSASVEAIFAISGVPVPEPSALATLALGLTMLATLHRRQPGCSHLSVCCP